MFILTMVKENTMSISQVSSDLLSYLELDIDRLADCESASQNGDTISISDSSGEILSYDRNAVVINGGNTVYNYCLPTELRSAIVNNLPETKRLRAEANDGLRCCYCLSNTCVAHTHGESVCG